MMSERVRELLLKAVRALEPDERDEVLAEALVGAGAPSVMPPFVAMQQTLVPPPRLAASLGRAELEEHFSTSMAVASGDLKLLPVRLPVADYERLRTWSREHGFSMAVIIRTLVERFLDGQEHAARPAPPLP